jgi:hypothetical protein
VLKTLNFLTQPNGQPMKTAPATLGEGLKQSLLLSKADYSPIKGGTTDHELFVDFDNVYEIPCKMLPGSKGDFLASIDGSFIHLAIMDEPADEKQASAKFTALCKQVAATSLSLGKPGAVMKLSTTDKIVPANTEKAMASFSIGGDTGKHWQDIYVMVILLYSEYFDSYTILLAVGPDYAAEEWLDYF